MSIKERPILFSGPMVRALLDGSKTQTRRIVKPSRAWPIGFIGGQGDQDDPSCYGFEDLNDGQWWTLAPDGRVDNNQIPCPFGAPGDRLWVRETWRGVVEINPPGKFIELGVARYVPDQEYCRRVEYQATHERDGEPWRPSIHMPRWASRITLEVTGVRVERLQDISRGDAMDEGCPFPNMATGDDPRQWFSGLWSQINGADSWDANPWVWVVEFKRVT